MKECKDCGAVKPLDEFYKSLRGKQGVATRCKACESIKGKLWVANNPERQMDKDRRYKKLNPGKLKRDRKKYNDNNKEKQKLRRQLKRQEDPGYYDRNTKRWKEKNPDRVWFFSIKQRAKTDGIFFDLEFEDIIIPDFCLILGIPLFRTKGKKTDNTPSLDRINPNLGYIKGNIQVLSFRANRIKCNASPEELVLMGLWGQAQLDKAIEYV